MPEIIPCGNDEFDRMFGGGIPFPSLMLIEGGHGTGKSDIRECMSYLNAYFSKTASRRFMKIRIKL